LEKGSGRFLGKKKRVLGPEDSQRFGPGDIIFGGIGFPFPQWGELPMVASCGKYAIGGRPWENISRKGHG